jgi:uncharacterized repeat protein (TIGR03803 family)
MNAKHSTGLPLCFLLVAILTACTHIGHAQTAPPFTTLHSFIASVGGPDGYGPWSGLIQGADGDFYGTTSSGGANSAGTVFKIMPSGTITTLYSFSYAGLGYVGTNPDGAFPYAGLVQDRDGFLYGTTFSGGANSTGTVFKITTAGAFTVLHTFSALDSQNDNADGTGADTLLPGKGGFLYGTTTAGGANGAGTVFKITTAGALTTLYSFGATSTDGAGPSSLILGTDGNLYGTTYGGGANGTGTVFKITTSGAPTTLYSFGATGSNGINSDGAQPEAALMQARDGALYGTTTSGGADGYGTIFTVAAGGALTSLHSFTYTDGAFPYAGLVKGKDGSLYGTTPWGGVNGAGLGTVFKITTGGAFTSLYSFTSPSEGLLGTNSDGTHPYGGLLQGKDGNLYGTANQGGTGADGTVFKLTMIPVITSFSPNVGSVGTRITLTGANFTEATAVKFGGINVPNFTINSDTSLSFTVPAPGVASAKILVINPFGKGTSVRAFVMTPVVNSFSPGKGPVGTTVTLKGANFTAATAVMVGTVPASFTVISDTKMTLTVPTSAVTAPISVVNSYGTGVSNRAFMVTH